MALSRQFAVIKAAIEKKGFRVLTKKGCSNEEKN